MPRQKSISSEVLPFLLEVAPFVAHIGVLAITTLFIRDAINTNLFQGTCISHPGSNNTTDAGVSEYTFDKQLLETWRLVTLLSFLLQAPFLAQSLWKLRQKGLKLAATTTDFSFADFLLDVVLLGCGATIATFNTLICITNMAGLWGGFATEKHCWDSISAFFGCSIGAACYSLGSLVSLTFWGSGPESSGDEEGQQPLLSVQQRL